MRAAVIGLMALAACSSPSGAECAEVAVSASSQLEARVQLHRRGCAVDADCALVPLKISCFTGCPAAAVASEKDAALADVAALDQSICGATSCQISSGCEERVAGCVMGICLAVDAGTLDAGTADGGSRDGG